MTYINVKEGLRDQVYGLETKTIETKLSVSSSRLRPRLKCQSLETETLRDSNFLKLSRPRLIETKEFFSCRDRDSSRPENLVVVETETHRDWTKVVETETLTRLF